MVMISIHTIMSTTSSCQPHHEIVGKCSSAERVNSRVKTLLGAKPCFSCVMVTELGSLFLRFRTSIWRSYRQKVHRTVERAQFALRNVKKHSCSEHFWKMRSAKSVPERSESSICMSKNLLQISKAQKSGVGALLADDVGNMH